MLQVADVNALSDDERDPPRQIVPRAAHERRPAQKRVLGQLLINAPPDLPKLKNMIFNMRCGCKCRCYEPFKQVKEFDELAKFRKTLSQLDKPDQDNHAAPSEIQPCPFHKL